MVITWQQNRELMSVVTSGSLKSVPEINVTSNFDCIW